MLRGHIHGNDGRSHETSVALASRHETEYLTVDGLKNRTLGQMQNPPHPPGTMLSGAAGRLLRYKTNRTPSDLVRVVNIVRGERGDEELQLSRMQGFDFIVHLLSLLAFKHTLRRALHDSDICGHWLSVGRPLVCHWSAIGWRPAMGRPVASY